MNKYLIPFLFGVGVGVAMHKSWPKIQQVLGPMAQQALVAGNEMVEKGRETFWSRSEKFADLIAEIREEEMANADGSGAGDAASDTPAS